MLVALSIVVSDLSVLWFLVCFLGAGIIHGKQVLDIEKFVKLASVHLAEGRPDRLLRLCYDLDMPLSKYVVELVLLAQRSAGVTTDNVQAAKQAALDYASKASRMMLWRMVKMVASMLIVVAVFTAIFWVDKGQTGWVIAPFIPAALFDGVFMGLWSLINRDMAQFFNDMPVHLEKVRQVVEINFRQEEAKSPGATILESQR